MTANSLVRRYGSSSELGPALGRPRRFPQPISVSAIRRLGFKNLSWCSVVGVEGHMQSTAAAANSQWVFQTPVDVNMIYLSRPLVPAHAGRTAGPAFRRLMPLRAGGSACARTELSKAAAEPPRRYLRRPYAWLELAASVPNTAICTELLTHCYTRM